MTEVDGGGMHYSEGKLRMDLIPPLWKRALAEVLTYGAKKYDDHNWLRGMKYSELQGSVERHWLAWQEGEELDAESGLPHLAHMAVDVLMLLLYTQGAEYQQFDDRRFKRKALALGSADLSTTRSTSCLT